MSYINFSRRTLPDDIVYFTRQYISRNNKKQVEYKCRFLRPVDASQHEKSSYR